VTPIPSRGPAPSRKRRARSGAAPSIFLAVDFGTTSTKSALVDAETGALTRVRHHPAIPATPARPGRFEVPLEAIHDRFLELCAGYAGGLDAPLAGIVVCSEMHGFALVDGAGRPRSPYVSWKDERSREPIAGVDSVTLVTRALGDRFRAVTGMRPRPGFPLMNLVHVLRESALPDGLAVVSLPDWLARARGDWTGLGHPTMLAGMALYDLGAGRASAELLALVRELTGRTVTLAEPAEAGAVAGAWRHAGRRVPIHVGTGDHQTTLLGAGVTAGDCVSLNLGTGSQLAVLGRAGTDDAVERRPYFDGGMLHAITHIPAGRALAELVGFLEDVARAAGAPAPDFWPRLAALDAADLAAATLDVDLAVFQGAWGYRAGGHLARIEEGTLTARNYLASVLRAFVRQYAELVTRLDPGHRLPRLVLSGGLARRLPALPGLLAGATGYAVTPPTAVDESLLGLRALALVASGRARTAAAAQAVFGRDAGPGGV
jgi:xylulokinase